MRTWQRWTSGLVVMAVGVAFIVMTIVTSLFSVGPAFDRMSDAFRPVMKTVPLAQLHQDIQSLAPVSGEYHAVVPTFAQGMAMTPGQFYAVVSQDYPDVAAGIQQLPAIVDQFNGVVGTLQAEQGRFVRADAIPTSNLPAGTIPWALLISGIILIALGALIIFLPGRLWAWLVVAFSALLIVGSVAFSLPQKASAADTLNAHLKPVYTAEMVAGAKAAVVTVGAMGQQLQSEMLPALADRMGMNQAQLQAFMQENMPATSAATHSMPATMTRFQNLVATFDQSLADYQTLTSVSFVPIVWTLILGSILSLLAGALGLFRRPAVAQVHRIETVEQKAA